MTPLRQRMINDLTVRGLTENTQKSYLSAVAGLAKHYHRSPDQISAQEVQDYLLYLHQKRHLSWRSCNTIRHGLRFFFRITVGWSDTHFYLPGAKQPSKLPEVLSGEELTRLFRVTTKPKPRTLLMATYAAGLRVSEVIRLRVSDIDSPRMSLRIEQGKGQKDRYVPLSPRLLEQLREYWRRCHPSTWLFPGYPADRPMSRDNASRIYHIAKDQARIRKAGGIHTLRHCYATGLLEAGVELCVIQRRLGHTSIRSTMRYLHIAQDKTATTTSPLDLLDFPSSTRT